MSIYGQIGEPDMTNEKMTHLLKLHTFFHTHNVRIITHDASQIRTTHRVYTALNETLTYNFRQFIQTFFLRSQNFQKFFLIFLYIFLLKVFVLFYFKI